MKTTIKIVLIVLFSDHIYGFWRLEKVSQLKFLFLCKRKHFYVKSVILKFRKCDIFTSVQFDARGCRF